MKKRTGISFLLAALLPLFLASCGDNWQSKSDSNFSISFPGPSRDTATIEDNMSTLRVFYEPKAAIDPNAYYDISICDAPQLMLDTLVELKTALTADVKVYALAIDGKLKGEARPVKSGNVDGYEFTVSMEREVGEVTMRKFIHKKKMYTLRVITPADQLGNESVKKFMDSFQLK